jgi:predicted O-methyltransferase YrrM
MNFYYRSIASEEMSDYENFYRWVVEMIPNNAYLAEVGVADGRGVIMLASFMNQAGKACTIWAVDDFSYGQDNQRKVFEDNVRNCGETTIVTMDMDSLTASTRSQDEQFDMVFIDSSHLYEFTRAEIMLWFHKVKPNGILAGHDYLDADERNAGVKKAVDELIPPQYLRTLETPHGHGVWWMAKTPGVKLLK